MNVFLKLNRSTLPACLMMVCLTGCGAMVKYHIAKPISPKSSLNPQTFHKIDTCTPTLAWEAVGAFSRMKVDFWEIAIYQDAGWKYNSSGNATRKELGDPIYHVKQVYGTKHRVTEPLPIGQDYLWTVRPYWKEGGDVQTTEGWASFDNPSYFDHASGAMGRGAHRWATGALFTFATPLRCP